MAIPMLARNITGSRNESINTANTMHASRTASATYIGSSASARSLRSVMYADILLTKHCLPAIWRISLMVSIASSDEIVVLRNTAMSVQSPLLNSS